MVLTSKRQRLIEEYLVDCNAEKAALRAGYSASWAHAKSHQALREPEMAAALKEAMDKLSIRTGITQARVLEELSLIAFGDLAEFVEWGPGGVRMKDGASLDPEKRRALAEVAETVTKEGGSQRVKMHDKLGALNLLGKHLGMFNDKVEHSGTIEHTVKGLSDADLDARIQQLLDKAGIGPAA